MAAISHKRQPTAQPTTTPAAPRITERAWQAQVVQLARTLGYRVYHTHDSRHSVAGYPDLTFCRPPRWEGDRPRFLLVELKRELGQPTATQREWLDALSACGVEAYVWRPSDWDRVVEVLR